MEPKHREMYKWNWRVWVLGSMGSEPGPSAWLYNESYVDLSGLPFTRKLLAGAHVSNLQPPGRFFSSFQRQWDVRALEQHFFDAEQTATGPKVETVSGVLVPQVCRHRFSICNWQAKIASMPYRAVTVFLIWNIACSEQVHAIVRDTFQSLAIAPSSLLPPSAGKGTLKRFGLDLLVDEQLRVWLIEVNVLKGRYGLGIVKGTNGDMEREMVLEMVKAEDNLKRSLKQQARADAAIETKLPIDASGDAKVSHAHIPFSKLV